MKLAGKFMMEDLAPHTLTKEKDPSVPFNAGKETLTALDPERLLLSAHPLYAFDAQGLGFNPDSSSQY